MVFYLKYRPQNLNELDNQEVAGLIHKYLLKESLPHAFIFTGPKGTGKTSTARIIAKCINCLSAKEKGIACNKCDICLSITQGNHLDIMEIDAASNRGIDEIRALREKIKLSPIQLKFKVYIIDEVHMLTNEAFNALLKTLEEPPAHAIFILATTEIHKVPDTILSRCVRINFPKATSADIIHSLKRIVAAEKINIDEPALMEISELADGSFRDGAKILEEVSMDNRNIKLADIIAKMGTTDVFTQTNFIQFLQDRKTKELLNIIQKLNSEGKNIRQFFLQILNKLKDKLMSSYLGESKDLTWKNTDLLSCIEIFAQAFAEQKSAVIPSLPFEMAIVKYCEGSNLTNTQNIVQPVVTVNNTTGSVSVDTILPEWPQILEALKPFNHSLVGVLRSCKPISFSDDKLVIEAAYKFHGERISSPKTLDIISQVVNQVTKKQIKIEIVIRKR